MSDEKNVTAIDPIAQLKQHIVDRIATVQRSLKSQLDSVVAGKFTHRQHTVNYKALWPAREFLALKDKQLPKALWMSTAGAYLIEGLELLATLEHDVFNLRHATTFPEVDRAVVVSLDPQNQMDNAAQKTQSLVSQIQGQLLIAERTEIINSLRALLGDADPSVAQVREDLRDRLIAFIEHQIDLAAAEAGYHTVHSNKQMGAASMLATAESLIKQLWTLSFTFKPSKLKGQSAQFGAQFDQGSQLEQGGEPQPEEPRQIGQVDGVPELQTRLTTGARALLALNLNRVLTLALVAVSELSQDYATLRIDSTVSGRMDLLTECVFALQPQSQEEGADNAVAYRMKYGHERMAKAVKERTEQFRRDLERARNGLDRATKIIYEVVGLSCAFREAHRR